MFDLVSSNALRILITLLAGAALYPLGRRVPTILSVTGYATSALLAASFILDVGEVYNYSAYYKRAFWHFNDDVTTWLGAIFVWALLSRRRVLSLVVAMGILFSGTKISLMVIAVELAILWQFVVIDRKLLAADVCRGFGIAGATYLLLVFLSPSVITFANSVPLASFSRDPAASTDAFIASSEDRGIFERASLGNLSCVGLGCAYSHVQRPLEDRLYSSIGGLWMALQGGFAGAKFPNSSERFANLMMEANPWRINDTFDITRERWQWIGGVQTPYLQFGAGYGIVLMVAVLLATGVVGVVGIRNIVDGERGGFVAFTLFFIVNAVVNMTQPWLNPGPVLLLMGFCGTHILIWRLQNIQMRLRRSRSVASSLQP